MPVIEHVDLYARSDRVPDGELDYTILPFDWLDQPIERVQVATRAQASPRCSSGQRSPRPKRSSPVSPALEI